MIRPIIITVSIYLLTILAILFYTIYIAWTIPENVTIGLPFAFVVITGLALFTESILFALIFYKHLSVLWMILLPVFVVTSVVPIYFVQSWYSNRPVKVPSPGQLPVSVSQYNKDIKLVIDDYLKTEIDTNNMNIDQDTIQNTQIDTIIYSLDKTKFFAIIMAVAKDGNKQKYCANYRVGRRINNTWELGKPKGNIWSTCFSSKESFKTELRQYYYKSYSINNSSDRPEIWTDNYSFDF